MSKELKKKGKDSNAQEYTLVKTYKTVKEYRLSNGLTILYKNIKGSGVVTTNITYRVGARDEQVGQTGLAHMLEHMLFKPTKADIKNKIDSGAMQFERETGCILNANTWKDRTTYYFSYPKQYFSRALQIESERMKDVVLTDKEFLPERGNVLSEFDMYFGDPYFALSMDMISSAFHSHPYGHETIGFREDIEKYTVEKLKAFYDRFYDPSNGTLMIIGDIDEKTALKDAVEKFGSIKSHGPVIRNMDVVESKQEGLRRVEIVRPALSKVVAFGVKHEGFPTKEWFKISLLSAILTNGQDSILHTKLIDTGLASKVEMMIEPSQETNLGLLFVTLSKKADPEQIEKIVFDTIAGLTPANIALHYKKVQQRILTEELIGRESSMKMAMELTEYVSAGAWERFFDTEEIIKEITAKDIVTKAHEIFDLSKMTIGHFIGKQ
jgi:zinc protease